MPAVITLTTDFGTDDPFVGIMKGVILSIHPKAEIIDLTHGIEPQNVVQAAWVLKAAAPYFPKNTVHVAVVDPGVGGQRRPLAIQSGSHTFVGPDNGIFTSVLTANSRCFELTQKKYFLKNVSSTFHGRDVFAPVAAWIAKGTLLKSLGRPIKDPKALELPPPMWDGTALTGEVIYIDRFGNATTNISREMILQHCPHFQNLTVKLGRTAIRSLATHYSEVSPGKAGAIINSWNALEIFKREGHVARSLKLKPGYKIQVVPNS
jgi:S-adenosyl-L-methionine hydrolase (adenosine-forming)